VIAASDVDPRLVAALRRQLDARPVDATRIGWKYGSGDGERIGGEIAVGHLTSATVLEDGATYRGGGSDLHADVELAVEIGEDGGIARYAAALELVDLAGDDSPEDVVARNVWHRGVAFGPFRDSLPRELEGALLVNGERRESGPAPTDVAERLAAVSRALGAVGERLEPGDRVITGLIVNTPVASGDEIVAELGALGRVSLRVA
jgi:hypothetical protein